MARREIEHVQLPVPNGWFAVEFSRELREGDRIYCMACMTRMRVVRTAEGRLEGKTEY